VLLPPKQRAVLILCEVLRCSSGEAAQLLGTTVGAVNSARQRARATLHGARPVSAVARRPPARLGPTERALLERYVDALRRHDVTAVVALAQADAAQPVGLPDRDQTLSSTSRSPSASAMARS
jgi:RNA polymerase sigma-70 factor (ECF subfamily)